MPATSEQRRLRTVADCLRHRVTSARLANHATAVVDAPPVPHSTVPSHHRSPASAAAELLRRRTCLLLTHLSAPLQYEVSRGNQARALSGAPPPRSLAAPHAPRRHRHRTAARHPLTLWHRRLITPWPKSGRGVGSPWPAPHFPPQGRRRAPRPLAQGCRRPEPSSSVSHGGRRKKRAHLPLGPSLPF